MLQEYDRLLREMERQHIKAFSLAKRADINPSDLYSALNGNRPVFPAWRKRISAVLNVSEQVLFNDINKEETHD